ncbi:hypothetical protein [Flexivirga oryzae]|uniref:Uncharacterized protein n=1 Tax=Flexivirga oryzae TaxID=1794944 RepID=A0A839NHJ3_9MICO|nr:hypothetical protein [Flexivirga oryzae]MBB2894575.1 hypothetical protein [Flexivirga oryzae]
MSRPAAEQAVRNIRSNHEDRAAEKVSVEALIRQTHALVENSSVRLSPSKVVRLCRDYVNLVADKGVSFGEYLANVVALDRVQRAQFDEVYYRLTYSDPTGEAAWRNIDGGRVSAR